MCGLLIGAGMPAGAGAVRALFPRGGGRRGCSAVGAPGSAVHGAVRSAAAAVCGVDVAGHAVRAGGHPQTGGAGGSARKAASGSGRAQAHRAAHPRRRTGAQTCA